MSHWHWISNAPVPRAPGPDPLMEKILKRLKDLDASLCESCRARVLDPLCPSCLEMAKKELAALGE